MDFANSSQKQWLTKFKNSPQAINSEKQLAIRNYAKIVLFLGERNKCRRQVILTAMTYVRRYFLNPETINSTTCVDVLLLSVTALYVAGKVEEETLPNPATRGVDIDQVVKSAVKKDEKEFMERAIRFEMDLLVAINFDLLCFHPLRPALGFLDMWHAKSPLAELDMLRTQHVWVLVTKSYLVDTLMFEYPPSVLGMACVVTALKRHAGRDFTEPGTIQILLYVLAEVTEDAQRAMQIVLDICTRLELGSTKELDDQARAAYLNWKKRGEVSDGPSSPASPPSSQ